MNVSDDIDDLLFGGMAFWDTLFSGCWIIPSPPTRIRTCLFRSDGRRTTVLYLEAHRSATYCTIVWL